MSVHVLRRYYSEWHGRDRRSRLIRTQTPSTRIRLRKLHAVLGIGAPVGERDTA